MEESRKNPGGSACLLPDWGSILVVTRNFKTVGSKRHHTPECGLKGAEGEALESRLPLMASV